VPVSLGRATYLNLGCTWEFFKPVYAGDSFKVEDVIFNSIEDKTRIDGKGPRQFLTSSDRKYINQNDEVVCVVNRRLMNIILDMPTNNPAKDWKEFPLPQAFPEYEYTDEEMDAIERTFNEEEIRGSNPRYWEDVAVGDELKPVIHGMHNLNDQMLAYALQGFHLSSRAIRKESADNSNWGAVATDFLFQTLMGCLKTTFGTQMDAMLGHLITNWMGDDGFLKKFDSQNRIIDPNGDANWCRGKVLKKYIANGEHLVDIALWIESIRGWIVTSAIATIVLPSKNVAGADSVSQENVETNKFQVGDRVRIKDRPEWPGQYKLAGSEGSVSSLQEPAGFVMLHIEKTAAGVNPGTTLTFRSDTVEKL
jgi:hypothetical protein